MCTASWLRGEAGLELLFNRDERRERGPARPPEEAERAGVRYLAPLDADAGGTWIAASERGLVLCLLNGADRRAEEALRDATSRGRLIPSLIDAGEPHAALERLPALEPERFRAFRLLALAPGARALGARWDGRELRLEGELPDDEPVVSSSLDELRAGETRRAVWRTLVGPRPDGERLARFHASHAPERGAFSPCMHRADAATVSLTRVRVDAGEVLMEYHGGAPCETGSAVFRRLRRSRVSSRT